MVLPRPVEAVILDMDGTLHDTEAIYRAALGHAMADVGFSLSEEFCDSLIGIPKIETDQMLRDHLGPSFPLTRYEARYRTHCTDLLAAGIRVKVGALALLDHLTEYGLPRAIATSASRHAAQLHLARSGLAGHFRVVVTRDDVAHGKPHPDLFVEAARQLGVNAERCLAVEDSFHGIRAAHAAGMMAVMVPDRLVPNAEIRALCAFIARDLDEVRQQLRGA